MTEAQLDLLLDPDGYLGAAAALTDRALLRTAAVADPSPEDAP
nr:hypothetical protein [Streptacidiphilus albus]